MLANTIAVSNGKGGVGKTSLCANLAGLAAVNGWRVLLIDLDPQGNLASDLGYGDDEANDAGQNLVDAVVNRRAVVPLAQVRPQLDVVTGGDALDALEEHLRRRSFANDTTTPYALEAAVAPIAGQYNLIVIDCPPAMGVLVDVAFTMARFVVVPTKGDAASLNGLIRTASRFMLVRQTTNPAVDLLGVSLFGFGTQDTRLVAKARSQLQDALAGIAPVFETFIRTTRKAPDDMRELGLLAHEYFQTAANAPKWFEDRAAPRYSQSAEGLADDYQSLSNEILAAFAARQAVISAAA